jgi:hypothetical protein
VLDGGTLVPPDNGLNGVRSALSRRRAGQKVMHLTRDTGIIGGRLYLDEADYFRGRCTVHDGLSCQVRRGVREYEVAWAKGWAGDLQDSV